MYVRTISYNTDGPGDPPAQEYPQTKYTHAVPFVFCEDDDRKSGLTVQSAHG